MRWYFLVLLLVAVLGGFGEPAAAQSVGPKELCKGQIAATCTPLNGSPKIGDPVYYEFALYGGPAPETLDVTESYSQHFVPANSANPVTCTVSSGANTGASLAVSIVSLGPPLRFTVSLQGGQDAICRMAGTFITPGATAPNSVQLTGQGPAYSTNTVISSSTSLAADLSITKTRLTPVTAPMNISGTPGRARYRIEIATDRAVYLGEFFRVYDQLALFPNATAIAATLQGGSTCLLKTAGGSASALAGCLNTANLSGEINAPGWKAFASWGIAPGTLVLFQPGDSIVIEYEVEFMVPATLECVLTADSEGIRNRAFLGLAGGSSALQDSNNSNNDTVSDASSDLAFTTGINNVDPNCNAAPPAGPSAPPSPLTIRKTPLANLATYSWGSPISFLIQIRNTSTTATAYDLEVKDILGNLQGTPNFTAQVVNSTLLCGTVSCSQTSPGTSTPPAGPIVAFNSYYDRKPMWSAVIPQLGPGQLVNLQLAIKPDKPTCDFAPLIENKLIRNTATVSHKIDWVINDPNAGPTNLTAGYTLSDSVDVKMVKPPACAISVSKTSKPGKNSGGTPLWNDGVIFDGWKEYEVIYSSLPPTATHNQTLRIGTLIDAIRIENAFYATGMKLDYNWACADLSGGGVRGFDASGSGSASVNHVGQPHQGVRVMSHSGIVEFDPGASLKCDVRIKVQRPAPSDPYCFSDGQPYLQNLALMDGSRFFNANMQWPHAPKGMSWDAKSDKLANCFNLVVNKVPSTGVVSRSGGPVGYTITVTNATIPGTNGDVNFPNSAAGTRRSPSVTDMFYLPTPQTALPANGMNLNFAANPCTNGTSVRCNLYASPSTSQHIAEILRLPSQQSLTIKYTLDGPFEPHQFCNRARGFSGDGRPFYETYRKDYDSWVATACVLVRGSLQVDKSFVLPPWVTLGANTPFAIRVDCNAPSGFSDFTRNTSVSPGNPSTVIDRIVIGSQCAIDEVNLPNPAQWGDCEWEDPAYPAGRSALIDGSVEPHRVSVVNTLTCVPPPTKLEIKKELLSDPSCMAVALCTFRITVTNPGPGYHSGPVSITDTFANGPLTVFYDLGQVNPYQWDWQCAQGAATTTITCSESDLQLGPSDSSYVDVTLDMYPAGINCAVLQTPAQNPVAQSCVEIGDVYVDTTALTIEKRKLTAGNCDGSGSFALNCEFEFEIANTANSDFNGPLSFTDTISIAVPASTGTVTVITPPSGWQCSVSANAVTCSRNPVQIAAGGSITLSMILNINYPIPPLGNCAVIGKPGTAANTPPPSESCVDFNGVGQRGDHAFEITKQILSDPRTCSYTGNRKCKFRITVTYVGTATYSGTLQITDIYSDQSGTALVKTMSQPPTNGWFCPNVTPNALHDCFKTGVMLTNGQSETFDIEFDLTGTPPANTRNCVRLESPMLNPRVTDCVALGQQLYGINGARAPDKSPKEDGKKRRGLKLPKVQIEIDVGEIIGKVRGREAAPEADPSANDEAESETPKQRGGN